MNAYTAGVVGSGPAGLFVAAELLRRFDGAIEVDVFDRLPTPYGLVRYGVAPDHPRIKSVTGVFDRILRDPAIRFLGNVHIGHDLHVDELRSAYDVVVFATGAPGQRRLEVAGAELAGVHPAADVVSWYSGHPDARLRDPGLRDVTSAVVIGAGNVALDVARLLARPAASLRTTDIPDHVLAALGGSSVRTVHVLCRRGPEHARFATKELRELTRLDGVRVSLRGARPDPGAVLDPRAAANLAVLHDLADRRGGPVAREIVFHFRRRPASFAGDAGDGGVTAVELEPTGESGPGAEWLAAQLVVSAIGFQRSGVPGLYFDERAGGVPHTSGRVLDAAGRRVPATYVAGWLKRGPSGVIGSNKADAAETVRSVVEDHTGGRAKPWSRPRVDQLLRSRSVHVVHHEHWLRIDRAEIDLGRTRQTERIKIAGWAELLSASGLAATPGGGDR